MWVLGILGACIFLFALLAAYLPTVYIRQTNKAVKLLEQIEANTRKYKKASSPCGSPRLSA